MFKEVVAVVLAAGQSRRFGSDKRQSPYHGSTLLQSSLIPLFKRFRMVYVVIHPDDDAQQLFGAYLPYVHLIRSEHCYAGMGHSIADAIRTLKDTPATACAICLADMPELKTTTIQTLISAAADDLIVRPRYQGQSGHPVIFGHHFWPELMQLTGDNGAKAVIEHHKDKYQIIDIEDAGVIFDIDTPKAQ